MDILVAVPLVHIRNEPAVVLGQREKRGSLYNAYDRLAFIKLEKSRTSTLMMPSLSASSSQASPDPSLSASSWPEFGTNTQLSFGGGHVQC